MTGNIREMADSLREQLVQDRRHLHAWPELSFSETKTAAFIRQRLAEMGIPFREAGATGTVALIEGQGHSNNIVALRADIDALPIREQNDLPYASRNEGRMHACGHDAHTASLLGTARILQSFKKQWSGAVRLLFQPAEEKMPGGACQMIEHGALGHPVPLAVLGQHVFPALNAGTIGIRKGVFMASMDEIYITVYGKGGHGAQPQDNIDPVLIASQLVVALQQIVSRAANPIVPSVLSFGRFIGDGAVNIIPGEVRLEGTFRTVDEAWRTVAHEKMRQMATGIATALGGRCEFTLVPGYPCLINEHNLAEQTKTFAGEYLGKENVVAVDTWMASEDFAYYAQMLPSCFYLLGTGNKGEYRSSLHSPTFDIDENSLVTGAGLMAYLALRQLEI